MNSVFDISLEDATLKNAALLREWRNDEATREASHNMNEIGYEEHLSWLNTVLNDDARNLKIVKIGEIEVGCIRSDFTNEAYELSWTVCPKHRDKGIGKKMAKQFSSTIIGRIWVQIKIDNEASIKIAQHIGMNKYKEDEEYLYFEKINTVI